MRPLILDAADIDWAWLRRQRRFLIARARNPKLARPEIDMAGLEDLLRRLEDEYDTQYPDGFRWRTDE